LEALAAAHPIQRVEQEILLPVVLAAQQERETKAGVVVAQRVVPQVRQRRLLRAV
jgi:hypothetical protein